MYMVIYFISRYYEKIGNSVTTYISLRLCSIGIRSPRFGFVFYQEKLFWLICLFNRSNRFGKISMWNLEFL